MNMTPSLGLGALAFSTTMEVPHIAKRERPLAQHDYADYGCVRSVMEFMKWAHEQDRFPTVPAVQNRFNVSKATAYRWTNALAETYGIDSPVRSGPGIFE